MKTGLFIGFITLDLIYGIREFIAPNQKTFASRHLQAAGGPATNAAIAFSALGNHSQLIGQVGQHPISQLIKNDLTQHNVTLYDLAPTQPEPPPIASILVTEQTGDRTVISVKNSVPLPLELPSFNLPISAVDVVLVDGHQLAASLAIAPQAKAQKIPIVLEGGSWKPGLEKLLPFVDYAICSEAFLPPGCGNQKEVFASLSQAGIPYIAMSRGEQPILYQTPQETGEIPIPQIQVVDTLAAGDFLHGAFCHFLQSLPFVTALKASAELASFTCQSFGTRQWLEDLPAKFR